MLKNGEQGKWTCTTSGEIFFFFNHSLINKNIFSHGTCVIRKLMERKLDRQFAPDVKNVAYKHNTTHSGSGKSGTPSSSRCVRRSEWTSRLAAAGCKDNATSPSSGTSIFSALILRFSFFSPFSRTRGFFLIGGAAAAASTSCPDSPLVAVSQEDKKHGRQAWCSGVKGFHWKCPGLRGSAYARRIRYRGNALKSINQAYRKGDWLPHQNYSRGAKKGFG